MKRRQTLEGDLGRAMSKRGKGHGPASGYEKGWQGSKNPVAYSPFTTFFFGLAAISSKLVTSLATATLCLVPSW